MAIPVLNLPQTSLPSESILRGQQIGAYDLQREQTLQQMEIQRQEEVRKQREQAQKTALRNLQMKAFSDPEALNVLAQVDPDNAKKIVDYQSARAVQVGQVANGFKTLDLDTKYKQYPRVLKDLQARGFDISSLPEDYDPKVVDPLVNQAITQSRDIEKVRQEEIEAPKREADLQRIIAETEAAKRKGYVEASGGATGALVNKVMRDNPGMSFTDALYLVQTGFRKGTQRTEEGGIAPIEGTLTTEKSIEQAKSTGRKTGELQTEREFDAPKAFSSMEAAFTKNDNVIGIIDEIIPKVSQTTAGVGGTLISKLPINSEARDMQKQLTTVVANMGFDELQEMRNNSPTGGALGQVAVQEIKFLQSVRAYLEQDQSPAQLVKNLQRAKKDIIASKNRVKAAYDREYSSVQNKPKGSEPKGQIKFLGFE